MKKRNRKLNKKVTTISLVSIFTLLFLGVLVGSLLAKYIAVNREKAEIVSANFHISSDYLKEDGASYTVTDWGYHNDYDVVFEIYNYEEENTALIAADPIAYKINVPTGWTVTVKNENGDEVSPVNSVYTLPAGGSKHVHTVALKRVGTQSTSVSVTVTTTAPYATTLFASFDLAGPHDFTSAVVDHGNYVSVVINTNNYSGNLKVTWTDSFSPDNTNPDMKTWKDTSRVGVLAVNEHTVYELIFLKNTAQAYAGGIVVAIEGGV